MGYYNGNGSVWPEGNFSITDCTALAEQGLTFPEDFPRHTDCTGDKNSGAIGVRNILKECMENGQIDWYDVNGQWLDDEGCNYGSGQDQMTMTYVSFTV